MILQIFFWIQTCIAFLAIFLWRKAISGWRETIDLWKDSNEKTEKLITEIMDNLKSMELKPLPPEITGISAEEMQSFKNSPKPPADIKDNQPY